MSERERERKRKRKREREKERERERPGGRRAGTREQGFNEDAVDKKSVWLRGGRDVGAE